MDFETASWREGELQLLFYDLSMAEGVGEYLEAVRLARLSIFNSGVIGAVQAEDSQGDVAHQATLPISP